MVLHHGGQPGRRRGQRCQSANLILAQLLFLESDNPDKDISLYIMIRQPHGGSQGVAADIEILAREVLYQRLRFNTITGQTLAQIEKVSDRNNYMSARQGGNTALSTVCWSRATLIPPIEMAGRPY